MKNTEDANGGSLHAEVGASGQWFSFFMRDGSIEEIQATDAEAALELLGKKLGKDVHMQRYWLLQEIETCLTPI